MEKEREDSNPRPLHPKAWAQPLCYNCCRNLVLSHKIQPECESELYFASTDPAIKWRVTLWFVPSWCFQLFFVGGAHPDFNGRWKMIQRELHLVSTNRSWNGFMTEAGLTLTFLRATALYTTLVAFAPHTWLSRVRVVWPFIKIGP